MEIRVLSSKMAAKSQEPPSQWGDMTPGCTHTEGLGEGVTPPPEFLYGSPCILTQRDPVQLRVSVFWDQE